MSKKFKFDPEKRDPDDHTTTSTNGLRALTAEFAVEVASQQRGELVVIDEDSIGDLFTDMCHLCDKEGLNPVKLMARAKRNWRAER